MRYQHVARLVFETPWAILPDRLAVISEFVRGRMEDGRLSAEEVQSRIGAGPATKPMTMSGTVAVLPLFGVLTQRAGLMTEMSGGTSLQGFSDSFAGALNDPSIDAILIDIDSPGGSTDLVPETAAQVRAARGVKPVFAIANTLAASAAYWIGSQAEGFVASPSAEVGSIGVIAAHDDFSAAQEAAGVKTTLVRAGKFKGDTSPFQPLSDEARAALQERVNQAYDMFVRDVANGRQVGENAVRNGFGEGRVVTAKDALAEGMIDRIDTFDATVARLLRMASGQELSALNRVPTFTVPTSTSDLAFRYDGLSFAHEAKSVRTAAASLVERLTSLAEVERGSLAAAKRESLSACPEALRAAAAQIDEVLTATDPNGVRADVLREIARTAAAPHVT